MKLNNKKVMEIMQDREQTKEMICTRTGLYMKSLLCIFDNGFCSDDALLRIADAIGARVNEIVLPDITENVENGIEFLKDSDQQQYFFHKDGTFPELLSSKKHYQSKNVL